MFNSLYIKKEKGKNFFTEQGLDFTKEKVSEGLKKSKIAELLGISVPSFVRLCECNSIVLPEPTRNSNKDLRRNKVNDFYFSKIDAKEKAYWLGFLSSDGYISSDKKHIKLTLQEGDKTHIEKFAKVLETTYPIHCGNHGKDKKYRYAEIVINSPIMVRDLDKLGVYNNKSLTLVFPNVEQVPEHLIKYWILGYYDGDGGITCFKSEGLNRYISYFTGTFEVLTAINNYFGYKNKIYREHRCENNTFRVSYNEGKTDEWLSSVYDEDSIKFCLERKYEKFKMAYDARHNK